MNGSLVGHPADGEVAHLFVDFSNLWCGVRAEAVRRGDADWAVRLHADNLRRVLAAGRVVGEAVLVANRLVPEAVLRRFETAFKVELVETGSLSGTEQGADELLQNAVYRTVLREPAGTIVLATGDGARWREGRGFCEALRGARRMGFGVEVAAFAASLNGHLREIAASDGGALVLLDRHYESVAFLEGLRSAGPISLRRRATAAAARWTENGAAAKGAAWA